MKLHGGACCYRYQWDKETRTMTAGLSDTFMNWREYQLLKHCAVVYNSLRQVSTTLESYRQEQSFNWWLGNTVFTQCTVLSDDFVLNCGKIWANLFARQSCFFFCFCFFLLPTPLMVVWTEFLQQKCKFNITQSKAIISNGKGVCTQLNKPWQWALRKFAKVQLNLTSYWPPYKQILTMHQTMAENMRENNDTGLEMFLLLRFWSEISVRLIYL